MGTNNVEIQGANRKLSNLLATVINTSLISDTDSTDDLGSSSKYWANAYIDKLYLNSGAPLDGAVANTVTLRYSQSGGTTGGIHVINEFASDADALMLTTGYGTNVKGAFIGRSARGTEAEPTATINQDELVFFGGRGYGATGFVALASAAIIAKASENFTDSAQGSFMTFETTDIGSAASTRKQRIKIGSTTIVVNEDGHDCDFRIEGDTATNLFNLNAGLDQIFITKTSSGAQTQPFVVQNSATAASTAISQIFANTTDVASYTNGLTVLTSTRQTDGSNDFSLLISAGGATAPAEILSIDGSAKNVGIGIATALAKLHIDQSSTTGAKPVITLDQADVDEDFFKFIGTSDTSADRALVDAVDFSTIGALKGYLKINIQDDQATNPIADGDYYIPFYAAPTA